MHDLDSFADAKPLSPDQIPIIDISGLTGACDHTDVARKLHEASQSLGFIYIKGHGIPALAIDEARSTAYQFFRADNSEKARYAVSTHHRGWLQPGASRMQDDLLTDLKESFIWGQEGGSKDTAYQHPLRGPNQWPDFVPHMQHAAMTYFQHAHDTATQLMRGFALGLNLPEDFFLKTCSRPVSRASFVYYPPQTDGTTPRFGVGPHTDFGVLTVLCQDDVGGLQVQDTHGEWLLAPPLPNTLVVNVGDLLSRWTDGAYKSTPHRVINASTRERLSLVLAFDPDPETLIDAREVFGQDYQPAEPPIRCGDYLQWRFSKAFAYRNATDSDSQPE
ncbi:MAG: isopenicillin N synthase family dioxygenase [Granulosicoccus sp.]